MLNKIQAKHCAPVSLCSQGCFGKLLLADVEKMGGFVGKYPSPSWIFGVCLSYSPPGSVFPPAHLISCAHCSAECCRGCWWTASFFLHDVFSSSNVLLWALCCLVGRAWVGIQPTNTRLSWRTCLRKLKLKSGGAKWPCGVWFSPECPCGAEKRGWKGIVSQEKVKF